MTGDFKQTVSLVAFNQSKAHILSYFQCIHLEAVMNVEESSINAENVMKARPQPLCFGSKGSLVDVIANRGKTRKCWNSILKVKEVLRRTIDQY